MKVKSSVKMNKGLNLSKSQQAILRGQWNTPLILIFYYLGEFIHPLILSWKTYGKHLQLFPMYRL